MKKMTAVLLIFPVFVLTSLFSVGFSSWFVTSPVYVSSTTTFGVVTEGVYMSDDYISIPEYVYGENGELEQKGIYISRYSSLHFLAPDGKPSDTGSIIVTCDVDVDKLKERLSEKGLEYENSITYVVTLTYENILDGGSGYKLFETVDDGTYYRSVSGVNTLVGENKTAVSNIQNLGDALIATGTVSGLGDSGTFTFGVEFVLNIPEMLKDAETPANFRHCFGKYISNKANGETKITKFSASARIVETE